MDLRRVSLHLRRWWWFLVLVGMLSGGLGYLWVTWQPPVYTAHTRLIIKHPSQPSPSGRSETGEHLVNTYAELATSYPVLVGTIGQLHLPIPPETLAARVRASPVAGTKLIDIQAVASSPQQAVRLADAIAQQLIANDPINAPSALAVAEPARPISTMIMPKLVHSSLLATVIGLLVAPGIALFLERRYLAIKQPKDVSTTASTPILGTIPRLTTLDYKAAEFSAGPHPDSPVIDHYETLRINLQMASGQAALCTILVSSPGSGEGKTVSAIHLALAITRLGMRVILIDANLHRPLLHRLFNLDNSSGLTTMLVEEQDEDKPQRGMFAVHSQLSIIPGGPRLDSSSELLAGERMELLLWLLLQEADVIILDAPPTTHPVTQALARYVDGVLLVTEFQHTWRLALRRATRVLQRVNANILGVILNKAHQQPAGFLSRGFLGRLRRASGWELYLTTGRRRLHVPLTLPFIAGVCLMLYGGGLYANTAYEHRAALGDNNLQPAAVELLPASAPNAFTIPVLNRPNIATASQNRIPKDRAVTEHSTVSRLVIPKIGLDMKVLEVGWQIVEESGRQVVLWEVAKYAIGHHQGSANPGEDSNVVLAAHVAGAAPVFKDLIMLEPGDQVTVYSQGQQYLYVVTEKLLVQELGVPLEVRAQNASYIEPTPEEMVTMITCWPPRGPDRFMQRVIVRAMPYDMHTPGTDKSELSNWILR